MGDSVPEQLARGPPAVDESSLPAHGRTATIGLEGGATIEYTVLGRNRDEEDAEYRRAMNNSFSESESSEEDGGDRLRKNPRGCAPFRPEPLPTSPPFPATAAPALR